MINDDERWVELPPIKTEREQAMRETIHGQGLSMVAMGKELREKDAIIARLTRLDRDMIARTLHEAHKPWCDYTYEFEHPMSSREVYEALADAVLVLLEEKALK